MGVIAGANINDNGLVFSLDAANFRSYSGSGLTSNGLVGGIGGTLVNGVGFGSTNLGYFIFDGSNDYINIANDNFVYGSSSRTMLSWSRISANDGSTHASFAYGTNGTNQAFFIGVSGLNPFCGAWGNDLTSSGVSVTLNSWFHTACVFDGTTAYLYVNGILNTSASKAWNTTNASKTYLGRQVDNGQYWNGNIGQVQLYNRVLSAQEIKQNYNATKKRYGL
jgi:hypothetical protein